MKRTPDAPDALDGVFRPDGRYARLPGDWAGSDDALSQRRFFDVLGRCLASLPPATARAFTLREVEGLEVDEICKVLDLTPTHCRALLYRARMRLRECLQEHWFDDARRTDEPCGSPARSRAASSPTA